MELIARGRGKHDFSVFYRERDVTFDFVAAERNNQWRVSFEFETERRIPFKEKKRSFDYMFKEFQQEKHSIYELSLGVKGAVGNIANDVAKHYGFRIVNHRKLAPEEGSIVETHIFLMFKKRG